MATMDKLGINAHYMVGQGYDGASSMSGRLHGTQQYVKEICPLAIYVHCASHSLNLAISDACELLAIRNCMGSLRAIYNFFNTPKRQLVLSEKIDGNVLGTSATRLKQLCPTRWIQRHESVMIFLELQHIVIFALEEITSWSDKTTASTATQLLSTIKNVTFQISLHTVAKIFAVTLPLSRFLQNENLDLAAAIALAIDVQNVISDMRREVNTFFLKIFNEVSVICEEQEIAITFPRRTAQRCDVSVTSPEEYYRIHIFIPFLDAVSIQIEERLTKHKQILTSFNCILPKNKLCLHLENNEEAKVLLETYQTLTNCSLDQFLGELRLWRKHIDTLENVPTNGLDALLFCNENMFPTVHKLLKIFVTLPITTASTERSFSTLRRLKSYLRNTIGEERLNGLALLNIHRDLEVPIDDVLNEMAQVSRRLNIKL